MHLKFLAAFSASTLVLKRAGVPLFVDSDEQLINESEAVTANIENENLKPFKVFMIGSIYKLIKILKLSAYLLGFT